MCIVIVVYTATRFSSFLCGNWHKQSSVIFSVQFSGWSWPVPGTWRVWHGQWILLRIAEWWKENTDKVQLIIFKKNCSLYFSFSIACPSWWIILTTAASASSATTIYRNDSCRSLLFLRYLFVKIQTSIVFKVLISAVWCPWMYIISLRWMLLCRDCSSSSSKCYRSKSL